MNVNFFIGTITSFVSLVWQINHTIVFYNRQADDFYAMLPTVAPWCLLFVADGLYTKTEQTQQRWGGHVPVQFPHTQRQDQIQRLSQASHPCISRCMWMNLWWIVVFLFSTFQRPIFALYEPLRDAFCRMEMVLANQIRIPVVSYVSLGMSANDITEYQNLCKIATF